MTWEHDARCRPDHNNGVDVGHLFFAEDERGVPLLGSAAQEAQAAALDLCRRCPVRSECLADVMSHEKQGERHGIRGGKTVGERMVLGGATPKCKHCHKPLTSTRARYCNRDCSAAHRDERLAERRTA